MESEDTYMEEIKKILKKTDKSYFVTIGASKADEFMDTEVEILCNGNAIALVASIWEALCNDERLMKGIETLVDLKRQEEKQRNKHSAN